MSVNIEVPTWRRAGFAWQAAIAPYARSNLRTGLIQLATSVIPYLVFWWR